LVICLEDVLKVLIDVSNIFLPHPNPPLIKGRELDFPVSPLDKGGLRGVKPGYRKKIRFVYTP